MTQRKFTKYINKPLLAGFYTSVYCKKGKKCIGNRKCQEIGAGAGCLAAGCLAAAAAGKPCWGVDEKEGPPVRNARERGRYSLRQDPSKRGLVKDTGESQLIRIRYDTVNTIMTTTSCSTSSGTG